jgi:hypothetical protein
MRWRVEPFAGDENGTNSIDASEARGVLKALRKKEGAARGLFVHRLSKACSFVNLSGSAVVNLHFQSELAAAQLATLIFHGLQKQEPYTPSSPSRQHGQIMDIDERPGRKSRKTTEADGYADSITTLESQENYRRRMAAQPGKKRASDFLRQGLPITHGIARISIDQFHDGILMRDLVQVSLYYLYRNVRRCPIHSIPALSSPVSHSLLIPKAVSARSENSQEPD